jgi:hypothetical protein
MKSLSPAGILHPSLIPPISWRGKSGDGQGVISFDLALKFMLYSQHYFVERKPDA